MKDGFDRVRVEVDHFRDCHISLGENWWLAWGGGCGELMKKQNCSGGDNGQDELKMTLAFLGMP